MDDRMNPGLDGTSPTVKPLRGLLRLLIHCIWIGLLWTVCLPRIGQWQPIREHIRQMEASNIAVDAMFYSELEWHPGR
jgi:hypothetical protein